MKIKIITIHDIHLAEHELLLAQLKLVVFPMPELNSEMLKVNFPFRVDKVFQPLKKEDFHFHGKLLIDASRLILCFFKSFKCLW